MVPCHIVQQGNKSPTQGEKCGVCPIWNEVRIKGGTQSWSATAAWYLIRIYSHGPCIIISDLGLIRSPRFAHEEVVTAASDAWCKDDDRSG